MSGAGPVRKSGRERKPNQRYLNDVLYENDASEPLPILGSDSEADAPVEHVASDSDDQEFTHEQLNEDEEAPDEDESLRDEVSDGSRVETPVEEDLDGDDVVSFDDASPAPRANAPKPNQSTCSAFGKASSRREKPTPRVKHELRSRGILDVLKRNSRKADLYNCLFGSAREDWLPAIQSRNKWINDVTLPRRRSKSDGSSGMSHPLAYTPEQRQTESTVGWDWYYLHGGRDSLLQGQNSRRLDPEEGSHFLLPPRTERSIFLIGPPGRQRVFQLSHLHSLSLDEAWDTTASTEVQQEPQNCQPVSQDRRNGWIINTGNKVRCLEWAPNHNGGPQYLAVANTPPKSFLDSIDGDSPDVLGGFPPFKSCVQIWQFAVLEKNDSQSVLDSRKSPLLERVICTEWGNVKTIKWCPVPRNSGREESNGRTSLGLIAGIWDDGFVRVFDLQFEESGQGTNYVKYETPAFAARPLETNCTCLTWLSASDLAVGCSDGSLAVYNLHPQTSLFSHQDRPQAGPQQSSAAPYIHIPLHQTYVISLTSAYPVQSHLIISKSMDGHLRLTDLRAPHMDSVYSMRSRLPSGVLVFSPALMAALSVKEQETLFAAPLRCLYTTTAFAKGNAAVLSLAAGAVHPMVLAGCADGTVVASNPMRRILARKSVQHQQVLFKHEWTSQSGGMSRFTEGYKVDTFSNRKPLFENKSSREGVVIATIYAEETGCTAVCWSPNLSCGGWIGAGWGSGLVRVQDVAI